MHHLAVLFEVLTIVGRTKSRRWYLVDVLGPMMSPPYTYGSRGQYPDSLCTVTSFAGSIRIEFRMYASVDRRQAQGVGWDCGKSVEQGVQLCQCKNQHVVIAGDIATRHVLEYSTLKHRYRDFNSRSELGTVHMHPTGVPRQWALSVSLSTRVAMSVVNDERHRK